MLRRTTVGALVGALLLAAGCSDSVSPDRPVLSAPQFEATSGTGEVPVITLSQFNGTLGEFGTTLIKGFDPNPPFDGPHIGDAIIATFFWVGSTNIIDNVSDRLNNGTPVGNTYHLVEYVQAGGISMATYVATDVKNFPDPPDGRVLVVEATLSQPGTVDGGMLISSWTGVDPDFTRAFTDVKSSASGSGDVPTTAAPGAINVDAGALAYGVTMSNTVANVEPPADFTHIAQLSDAVIASDGVYAVQTSGGSVNPQWTWFFNQPSTWLATAIALNPAAAAPPPATQLAFTVQPSNALPGATIRPPVEVTALDASGNRAWSFNGDVTIAIGKNAGCAVLFCGTLHGTKTVTAVDGVATFRDLSIDRPGIGYTLVATSSGLTGAESNRFTILTPLPWP